MKINNAIEKFNTSKHQHSDQGKREIEIAKRFIALLREDNVMSWFKSSAYRAEDEGVIINEICIVLYSLLIDEDATEVYIPGMKQNFTLSEKRITKNLYNYNSENEDYRLTEFEIVLPKSITKTGHREILKWSLEPNGEIESINDRSL